AAHRGVLVRILEEGETVVQIDPKVTDVHIEREFGARGNEDALQFGMLEVSEVADADGEIEGVLFGKRPDHLRVELQAEAKVCFGVGPVQVDVVGELHAKARAKMPAGRPQLEIIES